jgi:glycosyltransferase involved in cell wall biosynthesis
MTSKIVNMKKLSVIICSRNRAYYLERCLDNFFSEELEKSDGELILVNNGSEDRTTEVMSAFRDNNSTLPIIIVNESELGLGRARNAGIRASSGKVIIFTDDDCYLAEGYITKAAGIFDEGDFSYCSGSILQYDSSDSSYGCREYRSFSLIGPDSFIPAGKIQGANLIIHRDVFEKIGLFDPFLGAGTKFRCEDLDICARASIAGFTGALVPDLVVYHHHGRKPGEDIDLLKKENDYSRGAYYAKFILLGKGFYFTNWIKRGFKRRSFSSFFREFQGGVDYLVYRLFKRKRDRNSRNKSI